MRRNKRKNRILLLLLLLLIISVGYAALSTTLKVNGTTNIGKNTWEVYWDDPVVSSGSVSNTLPDITEEGSDEENTKLVWSVILNLPGDFYEFYVYAVNNGTIDAMITGINDDVTPTLPNYIKYEVTYADGTTPAVGDVLAKKSDTVPTRLKYKVRVYYDRDAATIAGMNTMTENVTYTFSLGITYAQKDDSAYSGYSLGDIVKYDPVNNSLCSSGSTCYEWNVLDVYDSKLKNNLTIQMDHNITSNTVVWISENDYSGSDFGTYGKTDEGPITALKQLESLTSSWDDSLKLNYKYDTTSEENGYGVLSCVNGACSINNNQVTSNLKARIITGEELADITRTGGADKGTIAYNWKQTSSNLDEWYFFSRKNMVIGTVDELPTGQTSSLALGWLVKNTTYSSMSGATNNTYGPINGGYWTLTPVSNDITQVWSVGGSKYEPYNGNVGAFYANNPDSYGLRPVITIPKTVLSN